MTVPSYVITFVHGTIVPPQWLNHVNTWLERAVEGTDGGTWQPSNEIVINGQGIGSATFITAKSGCVLTLESGCTVDGEPGATIGFDGTVTTYDAVMSNIARYGQAVITDSSPLIDPSTGTVYPTYILRAPTVTRTISLGTGFAGQRIRFIRESSTAFAWNIRRNGSLNDIVVLAASQVAMAEVEWTTNGTPRWILSMYTQNATPGTEAFA